MIRAALTRKENAIQCHEQQRVKHVERYFLGQEKNVTSNEESRGKLDGLLPV